MRDYFDSVIRTLVPVGARTDRMPRRGRGRRRSTFVPIAQDAVARAH